MESPPIHSDTPAPELREVRYEFTPTFPQILAHANVSLLVTTYQAGKMLVLGVADGQLSISFCNFEQAMGLAVDPWRIAIGSRRQIHFLIDAHECLSAGKGSKHDGCYVPRSSHYTGNIHGHDLAWGTDGLWIVNTLFSCLCTLHDEYNFVPRWRPRFISQLIDQDRCHLNGLAMQNGRPRFVTALSETDDPAGWRATKVASGCVIDVPSGETIARGFAMPHSPRLLAGRLYVLDSGHGHFGTVDPASGRYETVETCPGYTRGLAFAGQFAFVGLSKIRETAVFGGMPIAEKPDELRCGIAIVDLTTGRTVSVFQFHSGVDEIYAVDTLPGILHPMVAGSSANLHEHDVWIVPSPDRPPPAIAAHVPIYARAPQVSTDASSRADHHQLATQAAVLQRDGRFAEAAVAYQQAIATAQEPAALWVDLGNVRQEQGDQDAALACYRKAVEEDANCVAARQNLGYLLFNRGLPEQALEHYELMLQLAPTPMNRLLAAGVLPVVYDSMDEVTRWRHRLLSKLQLMVDDGSQVDATNQLVPTAFFVAYQGLNDLPVMRARGQIIRVDDDLDKDQPRRVGGRLPAGRTKGKIRIGFLSAYFRDHTIGRLNVGRIEHLDRDQFEVTVAHAARNGDELTERFRRAAHRFVSLPRDVTAARQRLSELDLDILLFADVGMDSLTSTLAFSRMAPIQCVTWGHPDTTGSPAMDYFVSSKLLEIETADAHYSESLLRLPLLGTYYERPRRTGPKRSRSDFGLPDDRHVYLCPQTLFKFHPEFDEILAKILQDDPDGDIVLLQGRVPEWTQHLQARWSRTLPASDTRTRILPPQPRNDFLALLTCADVVIDPIHFGGGNTSYEALAMGVPVVTLPGEFLRSRITYALYRKMGSTGLVADCADSYAELAVRLACDREYRQSTVQQLQERQHILFEDPAEVRCLEDGLRSLVT